MTVTNKKNTNCVRAELEDIIKLLFKIIKVLTLEEEDVVVSVGSETVASGPLACGDVGGVIVQSRSIRIGSSDGLGSFFLDLRIIFVGALQLS